VVDVELVLVVVAVVLVLVLLFLVVLWDEDFGCFGFAACLLAAEEAALVVDDVELVAASAAVEATAVLDLDPLDPHAAAPRDRSTMTRTAAADRVLPRARREAGNAVGVSCAIPFMGRTD
jgi:hypothetical protein